jgi:hypothetical protein
MHDFDTRKENRIVKVRNFQILLILCVIITLSFAKIHTNSNVETIFAQTLVTLRYFLGTPTTVYTSLFTKKTRKLYLPNTIRAASASVERKGFIKDKYIRK